MSNQDHHTISEAAEADLAAQRQPVVADDLGDDEAAEGSLPGSVPMEAPEGDALEQSQLVGLDDEDGPRGG